MRRPGFLVCRVGPASPQSAPDEQELLRILPGEPVQLGDD